VHGTASSHLRIEGPITALRITGAVHFLDVHRWDLLPSSGEDWRVRYRGAVDLLTHTLQLETVPARSGEVSAVTLALRINDFLTAPHYSVLATLSGASARDLLPLGKRMGLPFPQQLVVKGAINGAISYSNRTGLAGGLSLKDVIVTVPNLPALRTALATATVSPDRIHLDPAIIQTSSGGTLRAGGEYFLLSQRLIASVTTDDFSIDALKSTVDAWFGAPTPFALLENGTITGRLTYSYDPQQIAFWAGQFQFRDTTLRPPVLAVPLEHSQGRVIFNDSALELDHFSAALANQEISASYRYNPASKRPEHLRLDVPAADLADIQAALAPVLRSQGLLARLGLTRRSIPPWLAERNLDADLRIARFSINGANLGSLSSHLTWQGPHIQFASVELALPQGLLRAHGSAQLGSYSPQYRFSGTATRFPWRDGFLGADGEVTTAGTGSDILQNLRANGSFSGENVQLSDDDSFDTIAGVFDFSFANAWPDLRLSKIEASDGENTWQGQAVTQADGKLIVHLEHEGQQRHIVSTLAPQLPPPRALSTTAVSQ
jgi:hypothetical protein